VRVRSVPRISRRELANRCLVHLISKMKEYCVKIRRTDCALYIHVKNFICTCIYVLTVDMPQTQTVRGVSHSCVT